MSLACVRATESNVVTGIPGEAKRWSTTPSESFDRKTSISVIYSAEGRLKILDEVAMIEHGTF